MTSMRRAARTTLRRFAHEHQPAGGFLAGRIRDAYTNRNTASATEIQARLALWSEILSHTISAPPASILEVGANLGINLRALRLLSSARRLAVEPNEKARGLLVQDGIVAAADARDGLASAIDFPDGIADLAFTSGVLIHIHPDQLSASLAKSIDARNAGSDASNISPISRR